MRFAVTSIGLMALALFFAGGQVHPVAMAVFPVPVALAWARGQFGRSFVLVACAALVALVTTGQATAAALYVMVALLGVLLGALASREQRFGTCVAVLSVVVFTGLAANMAVHWAALREQASLFWSARIAEFEGMGDEGGSMAEAMAATFRSLEANWEYLNLGMLFGAVLFSVTLGVALVERRLRSSAGRARLTGSFATMRVPEWVVWAAIIAALGCFADQRWPQDVLRAVAWNSAVGLGFLYWLNGFSIFVFVLNAFKMNPFLYYALIFSVFYLGAHPIVCAFGLFDTWWDFRRKAADFAEARRLRRESGDSND